MADAINLSDAAFDNAAYTPSVGIKLDVNNDVVVSIGVTKLKNALNSELKKELRAVAACDAALADLRGRRDALSRAVPDDFAAEVDGRKEALTDAFGLGDDDAARVKVESSFVDYGRASGSKFRAEIAYVAPGGQDSFTAVLARRYPTPPEVEALEAEIDARSRERDAADRRARDLRIQANDRQGLVDQVTAELGVSLLRQAGDQGARMLDALMAPTVADRAGNPILALIDGGRDA